MKKTVSHKPVVSTYPKNYVIDSYGQIETLIVFIGALILISLAIGIDKISIAIGIIIALLTITHTLIKLSSIIRIDSKTYTRLDHNYKPFVSVFVACKNEPAEIVIETIQALQKLKYTNYEVLVINSNNQNKNNWSKIQKYISSCGSNYKFVHLDKIAGFKAGALNYLNVKLMSKKAEIEAIIDCDYIVSPDFLNKTVGYFKNPKVGIVQAPQNYYNVNPYNIGLFYEYRSFFRMVMHQAQRLGLVTFTGTMGLVRTDLINSKGMEWNEWCITEDVEAGTHINSLGYKGIYIDKNLGKGLMPLDYNSIIKQRQRWSYGNMQIICKDLFHVAANTGLSIQQKIAFLAQLVTWFHFELVIAVEYLFLSIIRSTGNYGYNIDIAINLMLGLLAFSVLSNLIYFLVGMRKDTTITNRVKAFLTHYGLLYVMSSSWITCLSGRKLGFNVTKKSITNNKIPLKQYFHEFIIAILLIIGLVLNWIGSRNVNHDLLVVIPISIIELCGILYIRRSFIKSNEMDVKK